MTEIFMRSSEALLDKIALNKLLRRKCELSLSEAKDVVDRLLDGERVRLVVDDDQAAQEFRMASESFGVKCDVLVDGVAKATS